MGRIINDKALDVFVALSDKTRLNIVRELLNGEKPCSELILKFNLSKSTFSHHAKILSRSGLVSFRRKGKFLFFSLDGCFINYSLRLLMQGDELKTGENTLD
ncbi:MAG: metalloregulator ArsR/SmtB family transcription factor [Clostridia bacterium]|nr:metalloregulator ArsR/SmtB family transcription factor [Clostridia bacterium]